MDVLALTCHPVDIAFNPPDVQNKQVSMYNHWRVTTNHVPTQQLAKIQLLYTLDHTALLLSESRCDWQTSYTTAAWGQHCYLWTKTKTLSAAFIISVHLSTAQKWLIRTVQSIIDRRFWRVLILQMFGTKTQLWVWCKSRSSLSLLWPLVSKNSSISKTAPNDNCLQRLNLRSCISGLI